MPDHNTPPGDLTAGDFGEIVLLASNGTEYVYPIQPIDYAYFGYMLQYEGGGRWYTGWAILQYFAAKLWQARWRGAGRFKVLIERYAAPLNPAFMYSGSPTPQRATVACSSITRRNRRGEAVLVFPGVTGGGGGSLPGQGARGIPGQPGSGVYNRIMCSSGRLPNTHGNDGQNNARRQRVGRIRDCLFGSDKAASWSGRSGLRESRRSAAWQILTARVGNPIEGFDGWRACTFRGRQLFDRIVDLSNLSATDARRAVQQGLQGRGSVGFRVTERGNCFVYHSAIRNGDLIYVRSGDRDSRRMPVPQGAGTSGGDPNAGNASASGTTIRGGTSVPVTADGLAPTSERPANAQAMTQSALGRESELIDQLEEWASSMETRLTSTFGGGRDI